MTVYLLICFYQCGAASIHEEYADVMVFSKLELAEAYSLYLNSLKNPLYDRWEIVEKVVDE